ncbi:hypothetical protein ACS0TY_021008 [Phlomoides rotata]
MGKHQSDYKQPGCMWGLVHVLGWHSNVRKMIHLPTSTNDAGPETTEKLLGEDQSLHNSAKRSRATKKRSLRARVKAMIRDEISKEKMKPNLQRTYSIHHLQSVKHPIIFLPKDVVDNSSSQSFSTKASGDRREEARLESSNEPDVYEIFKVDKELLLKHLQDSDKSAFGLNKSRSFPVAAELANGRKLKPVKLESKQNEVWSFPKENKLPRKHKHLRSSSLNESLDRYDRLFGNTSGKSTNLNTSRSLKLTNEYGIAPLYFTRMHSLSYVDSYYSNLNLELLVDNPSENFSVVTAKHTSSGQVMEDCESLSLNARDGDSKTHDQSSVLDEYNAVEPRVYEGLEHGCGVHELSSSIPTNDAESDEITMNIADSEHDGYHKKKSDLDYVRSLLEQSGIAVDASEIAWHSSNQLFSPQLFEEVEARWPHARDELTGCPDFYGCWHHQMLFDLVNEVLLEVYDVSLPYYPKPLSSRCHVSPFPVGDRLIDEVCRSIRRLVDMKAEENELLDDIVARDLDQDHSWMNLQMESEFVGFDIEDMIFDELVQEVVFS